MSTDLNNRFRATLVITVVGLLTAITTPTVFGQSCTSGQSGCGRNVYAGGCCHECGSVGGGFQQGCRESSGCSTTGCAGKGGGGLASLSATLQSKLPCRRCNSECGNADDEACGGGSCRKSLLAGGLLGKLKAKLDGGCGDGCGLLGGLGCRGCAADGGCGGSMWCGIPAPSYPVPYATPSHVGGTQFTYSPFMPHHSLPHYRHTYSLPGPGMGRTNVHWHPSYARVAWDRLTHVFEWPR